MTGVAADGPGRPATHLTFSVLENVSGRPCSVVEPLKNGPRHWDQFSARRKAVSSRVPPPSVKVRTHMILPWFIHSLLPRPKVFQTLIRVTVRRRITGRLREDKADSSEGGARVVARGARPCESCNQR